jgi:glycerol-3-phosphate acyltransferase PlsX
MVDDLLAEELQSTFSSQVGYLLSRRAYRRFRRRVDYSEYGGAPLLGVAGLCIVGHGRSSAKAVRNAVTMAARFASSDVLQRVEQEIASLSVARVVNDEPSVDGPVLSERKRVEG